MRAVPVPGRRPGRGRRVRGRVRHQPAPPVPEHGLPRDPVPTAAHRRARTVAAAGVDRQPTGAARSEAGRTRRRCAAAPAQPVEPVPAALVVSANGVDPVDLAVEISRVVPASGNLGVCGQQFWLGPSLGGVTIRLWIDTTVVHILRDQVRLKTLPSRFTPANLRQLLADGAQIAGPPPLTVAGRRPVRGRPARQRLRQCRSGRPAAPGRLPPGRTTGHRPPRRGRHAAPGPRPHPAAHAG